MPLPQDRRGAERFPVNKDTTCPFVSPVVDDFGPVRIKDISMEGIGLLVNRRLEEGTSLVVTLTNTARGFSKIVRVKIAHVTPQLTGFLIGGNFDPPLSYQEMSTLVM